jgi:hypothetical protein
MSCLNKSNKTNCKFWNDEVGDVTFLDLKIGKKIGYLYEVGNDYLFSNDNLLN